MTSEKQIAANRQNAKQSTGPKTKSGKNRSRQNALRHGLASAILEGSPEDQRVNKFARAILGHTITDPDTLRRIRDVKIELFNQINVGNEIAPSVSDQVTDPEPLSSHIYELLEQSIKLDRYESRARSRRKKALRYLKEIHN